MDHGSSTCLWNALDCRHRASRRLDPWGKLWGWQDEIDCVFFSLQSPTAIPAENGIIGIACLTGLTGDAQRSVSLNLLATARAKRTILGNRSSTKNAEHGGPPCWFSASLRGSSALCKHSSLCPEMRYPTIAETHHFPLTCRHDEKKQWKASKI